MEGMPLTEGKGHQQHMPVPYVNVPDALKSGQTPMVLKEVLRGGWARIRVRVGFFCG